MTDSQMKCQDTIREIPLYAYGEVSPEIEEAVEEHIDHCESCRAELARHRAFLESLEARPQLGEDALLAGCRAELRQAIASESAAVNSSWFEKLRRFSQIHIPMRIPVGAMALIAVGFFGARFAPERFGGLGTASLGGPMFSSVQSVEPDASGKVQISVNQVRRHVVSGDLNDPQIQALLLDAMRDESNPGVRAESIVVLENNADSAEVRQALINAATRDPNAGVRLKAVEGLSPYAGDPGVRAALTGVLLKDDNAGVRMQAVELLGAHRDTSIIGPLQEAVQSERDNYVRSRCRELLEAMKASVGTY